MRSLILGVILALLAAMPVLTAPSPADALSGATADSTDRFPYVVEIKHDGKLACSGTVLYPRIVITAAHCMQKKVYWRGGLVYVDEYAQPETLTVAVTARGEEREYGVSDVTVSPDWRRVIQNSNAGDRFLHDVAIIVTKEPVAVSAPPGLFQLTREAAIANAPHYHADDRPPPTAPASDRHAIGPLDGHGVIVAFGADRCDVMHGCENAGIRRYQPVLIKQSTECFRNRYTRPKHPSLSPTADPDTPKAVWCMESLVFPGDSGGALFVEDADGALSFMGVISAQQGLPPALAAVQRNKRSVASALYPSLGFITDTARKLGYVP
ncbi:Trypsin [Methyloligella halotolerans]|uniref:Trypsin n=1 Tax=Methyloligella halotolerans TaxID=1177755 RepID=A0A1E2S3B8_9HYPH|nr:trypsin-like serine protease [Methyloligella halotolerans]ODA68997.1 Trypsin [Methyloligella halotolerans]